MMIVNLLGLALIVMIVWWFWLYKPAKSAKLSQNLEIVVEDGVYTPSRINVPAEKPITLRFLRKDQSPCAATVIFPELEISEELPVGKVKNVMLPAMTPGTYNFSCQMQMYRGQLTVEN